jgi:hypothetical protein
MTESVVDYLESFVDELMKISSARDSSDTSKPGMGKIPSSILTGLGANLGGGIATQAVAPSLMSSIGTGSGAPMTLKDVVRLKRNLSPQTAVSNVDSVMGAVYIPKGGMLPKFMRPVEEAMYGTRGVRSRGVREGFLRGTANATLKHSPEFLAHELGHASLRDPSRTGALLRGVIRTRGIGPLAGIVGGSAMAAQDPESTTAKLAPVATGLGSAPMLLDEGLASYRGLKAIKDLGKHSPEVLAKMRGNLMKAFGAYGAMAAGTTGAMLAINKLRARNAALKSEPLA